MLEQITPYVFDKQSESWQKSSFLPNQQIQQFPLRIATFNVLTDYFPWFIEIAIQSGKRFEAICDLIADQDVDIIGLNEVTSTFLEKLMQHKTIRSQYFFSDVNVPGKEHNHTANNSLGKRMGNVILSRFPFKELYRVTLEGEEAKSSRETVLIGRFETKSDDLLVCSVHLTAYEDKVATRRAQLQELDTVINRFNTKNVIVMGDMNLHNQSENQLVEDFGYRDMWAETHFSDERGFDDGAEGMTFDVTVNTMIPYYIPCEMRRMRLDRILLKKGTQWIATSPVYMFANEPIEENSYLFPSDHFGLLVELEPQQIQPRHYTLSCKHIPLPHMGLLAKSHATFLHIARLIWLYGMSKWNNGS